MFSMDKILVEFVGNNVLSLYVLITLLKGVALMTKSTKDDKIATLLSNMFGAIRRGKAPDLTYKDVDLELKETPQSSDPIR